MSFNQSSPGLPDPSQHASTAPALTASFPPGGSQIPYAKKLFLAWAADAYEKDRQQGHSGPQMDRVKQVVATLVSLSVKCKSDTSEYTRKQRMTTNKLFTLWVINLWCKLTFKMETFGLMKNMIRNIDQVKLPMEDMPKSYIVTWHYYRGQFHLWQGELIEAAKNLTLAFEKCTRKDRKNKIRILRPLIIVRVMLGRFPQTALLLKYGMSQEFIACLLAVAKGNVVRFDEYMEASFDELRRWTAWSLVNGKWPIMMWRTYISRWYTSYYCPLIDILCTHILS